jgi:hypothetical protein
MPAFLASKTLRQRDCKPGFTLCSMAKSFLRNENGMRQKITNELYIMGSRIYSNLKKWQRSIWEDGWEVVKRSGRDESV